MARWVSKAIITRHFTNDGYVKNDLEGELRLKTTFMNLARTHVTQMAMMMTTVDQMVGLFKLTDYATRKYEV